MARPGFSDYDDDSDDEYRRMAGGRSRGADDGKTEKLFGMFEVDPDLAEFAKMGYNNAANILGQRLAPWIQTTIRTHGGKHNWQAGSVNKTAAVTAFGADLVLKGGGYFAPVIQKLREHQRQRTKVTHQIAPVLDEIKGGHSILSFMTVGVNDNEVLFIHRNRMGKLANAENFEKLIDLGVVGGSNLALSGHQLGRMWRGDNYQTTAALKSEQDRREYEERYKKQDEAPKVENTSLMAGVSLREIIGVGTNTGNVKLATHLKRINNRSVEKLKAHPDALDMILRLSERIADKPDADSFDAPGGRSYSLEGYIAQVLIQHSRDMAEYDPTNYTALRSSLKEEIDAAAKPLAKAIKDGDLSALSLIRLVGERKIIHNKGRGIASAEEVESMIERRENKERPVVPVDPKEYFAEASFSKKDLKAAYDGLQGEEKMLLASLIPVDVRKEIGISEAESKNIDEHFLKTYETRLAEIVSGLNAMSDEELKKEGLSHNEIKQVREAAETLKQEGQPAMHKLRMNPANVHGIEQTLTNWAVPVLKEGTTHDGTLAKVIKRGQEAMAAMPAPQEAANENELEPANENEKTYSARESARREANDNDMDAAGRTA